MRIYISGGITGIPDYMEHFEKAEKYLTGCGHNVVNPARFGQVMPDATWSQYMRLSYVALSMCDAIYMLYGWENSRGALVERSLAEIEGLEIFTEGDTLI